MESFLLVFFTIASLYLVQLRAKSSFGGAIVVLMVVMGLYFGGLSGHLFEARFAVWLAVIGIFGFILWRHMFRERVQVLRFWRNPEAFLFSLFAVWLIYKLRGASFSTWDEFSNWGPLGSFLVRRNEFTTNEIATTVQNYPLAHSLFQYFFMADTYKESIAYGAVSIWLVVCFRSILPRGEGALGGRWALSLMALVLVYFINYPLGREWHSVYSDHILGATFGMSLIAAYSWGAGIYLRESRWALFLGVMILPQLKVLGILFALTTIGLSALVRFFNNKNKSSSAFVRKEFGELLLFVAVTFISLLSWMIFSKINGLSSPYSLQIERLKFGPEGIALFQSALRYFAKLVLWDSIDNVWPLSVWLIALFVWGRRLMRDQMPGANGRRVVDYLMTCTCLYILTLFVIYILFFSDGEAVRLASFARYTVSFLMGLVMLWIWMTLRTQRSAFKAIRALVIPLVFLMLGAKSRAWQFPVQDQAKTFGHRITLAPDVEQLTAFAKDHPGAKIWAMKIPSDLEAMILVYHLPQLSWKNLNCASVRKSTISSIADCLVGEGFQDRLRNVDYLWISSADDQFWNEFGEHFDCGTAKCSGYRLFEVKARDKGEVVAKPYSP